MFRLFLVNDIDAAFAAHDNVIGANFLDASTHFHADHPPLTSGDTLLSWFLVLAVGYPTLRQIVRCQFNLDAVARD